jgi:hypothetical protein
MSATSSSYHAEREWLEENLEYVRKAVDRSVAVSTLEFLSKSGI